MCHWISESEIRRMHDMQTDKHRHRAAQPEQMPEAVGELGIAATVRSVVSWLRGHKPSQVRQKTVEV